MVKNKGVRKSVQLKRIENKDSLRVTLVKRRKGLVKKCIELSVMCQQDVFLVTFDKAR